MQKKNLVQSKIDLNANRRNIVSSLLKNERSTWKLAILIKNNVNKEVWKWFQHRPNQLLRRFVNVSILGIHCNCKFICVKKKKYRKKFEIFSPCIYEFELNPAHNKLLTELEVKHIITWWYTLASFILFFSFNPNMHPINELTTE